MADIGSEAQTYLDAALKEHESKSAFRKRANALIGEFEPKVKELNDALEFAARDCDVPLRVFGLLSIHIHDVEEGDA